MRNSTRLSWSVSKTFKEILMNYQNRQSFYYLSSSKSSSTDANGSSPTSQLQHTFAPQLVPDGLQVLGEDNSGVPDHHSRVTWIQIQSNKCVNDFHQYNQPSYCWSRRTLLTSSFNSSSISRRNISEIGSNPCCHDSVGAPVDQL